MRILKLQIFTLIVQSRVGLCVFGGGGGGSGLRLGGINSSYESPQYKLTVFVTESDFSVISSSAR